jgi:hypothetical protein
MVCTWLVTFQSRLPVPEATVAGLPLVAGWLAQVTPLSVQLPASWKA